MDSFQRALIFKTVVENQTMAAAARIMSVSPSVISKRITELEAAMGVQLLRRTTRRITLTEAGSNFYHRMVSLHGQWQTLLDETQDLGKNPRGRLTLAAPSPLLNRVLLPRLGPFLSENPDIDIEFKSAAYETLPLAGVDLSLARQIDDFDSMAYVGQRLCRYYNQLFASPNYLAQRKPLSDSDDLRSNACLLYGENTKATTWHFYCGDNTDVTSEASVDVSGRLSSNNTEALIAAACQGQGIAYVPELIIQDEIERGDLVPVLPHLKSKTFEMWFYYQKLDFVPLKLRVLLDFLKQQWKEPA
ncbi:LysR family transcriptional regulator [Kiloniella spongiae]|uniref:LysR family transcriptional regulator n=1 Tax=Kiloniella spongiae TaxID=1489064 RepID=A0A0H2MVL6_9PROT|nr:LysR family transcriptional regulator [Kiloniella spongiae]KLN60755.1 LysR family transcriptional regulator [Kiloniella spongiae]